MHTLLVDDHGLFREGMKHLLRHLRPDVVVHQSASVREAVELIREQARIDLILLDLNLPGMHGLQALTEMRANNDEIPVVVLSGSEDSEIVRGAIEMGAMGFIQKSVNSDQMLEAVETVLAGKVYLPRAVVDTRQVDRSDSRRLLERLGIGGRRAEVLLHLAQGKATKSIARELRISDTTVKTHIQAIYDALGVHSRTQAIYELARHGWSVTDIAV